MRIPTLIACAMMAVFTAMPVLALECANAGAVPSVVPDDTVDGNATACGGSAVAGGTASTALGFAAASAGIDSTAVGHSASSGAAQSIALGYFSASFGAGSAALGPNASSSGNFSIALGNIATSAGEGSVALGNFASSAGSNSTALGFRAFANQPDTVILGAIANVNAATTYARIGIGTTNPLEAVDVERSAAAARFQLTSFTATGSEAPQFIQRRARGTNLLPTAVQSNDNLGLFSFRGHNGTSMGGSRATITAQAAGAFSASSTPTRLIFATTPIGQTAPQSVLVITPDGKVQVNGVNLNVPDYVFEEDYELMPLDELRSFIDANGHLPGIAPAHEVKAEGLDLAGSQMNQLQKIEELTLYTLQQQELLVAQRGHLEALQERVAQLEDQLNRALAALD